MTTPTPTITIVHPITGRAIEPGETAASRAVHARLVAHRTEVLTRHLAHQATVRDRSAQRERVRAELETRAAAEATRVSTT